MDIHQIKTFAISSLENALQAHEKGDIFSIDDGFDEYDLVLPRENLRTDSTLYITLEFWAGWSDSAVHGWQFYSGIHQDDWPRLAKLLIEDLKADREVPSKELIEKFKPQTPETGESFFNRIKKKIGSS